MATPQQIYAHVKPAVELIMQELDGAAAAANLSIEELIHARIWPYITHAVREINPSAIENQSAQQRDARSKPWEYVVRFWTITPIDTELVAETGAEIMQGTGALQQIIPHYAGEMHDGNIPPELSEAAIKEALPQLRNNLGRQGSAVLRIPYDVGDDKFICQVDVKRLDS